MEQQQLTKIEINQIVFKKKCLIFREIRKLDKL